jgi:eukaryotic-like serine/threonine-protein kinase
MLEPVDDLQARLAAALAGRYTIEREIGRGGMSIVFLAFDPTLGRQVAIKVLRPELAASLGPERFLDEIKVAARLKHPYILKLHEAGEAPGLLYFSMPFVEGETLRQRLARERRLSVGDALRVAQEVAEALDHAHRQNVIHRDIKPENILFEEGHAVVSDFGIAKAISEAGDRRTVPGLVLGTVDYMSPEQEQGVQELDGRTDIYSLGLVLYEMLVGQTPGPDSGVDSLTGKRADVPVAVVRILRTALARDPANRHATAADFVAELEELTRARPVDAKRRRWVIAATSVSVLAIALILWGLDRRAVPQPLDPTHIAVLYFDDLSADSSLRAVAAGLSEDLMDRLVQVAALHVTSPYGVRPFRGSAADAPPSDSIARVLNVGTIVTGSVTSSAGVLRVTVRLVDGATGQALHSRQVQRPLGELFALQDTITADIAGFLRQRIGEAVVLRERRAGTSNVAAWQAVREGDVLQEQGSTAFRSGDDSAARRLLRAADTQYVRAHALDGRWSVPHLGRARVARTFAERLSETRSPSEVRAALRSPMPQTLRFDDEWMRVALAHAEEALRTSNGSNPEALELRGSLRYIWWLSGYAVAAESLAASERDLRAAVAGMPTLARGWASLSQLLRYTGRFAEAEEAAKQALEADAFLLEARAVYRTLLFTALNLEHYDEARSWCAGGRARFPTDAEFRHCELRILGWSGRGPGAIRQARHLADSLERSGTTRTGAYPAERRLLLATLYARSAERDSALVFLRHARVAAASDSSASWFRFAEAHIRLLLGERRAALDLIARGLATDPQLRDYVSRAVWFAPLHGDREFLRLSAAAPD